MTAPAPEAPTAATSSPPDGATAADVADSPGTSGPRRRVGCWVASGITAVIVVALGGAGVWMALQHSGTGTPTANTTSAFASAMRKAGVTATEPPAPVPLTSVTPSGSHALDATLTGDELAALTNSFPYEATSQGVALALTHIRISTADGGTVTLSGEVKTSGNSYTGTVSAPVVFESGRIALAGEATVSAEGLPIGGAQAQQATAALLEYANAYLAAAPGLHVDSAQVTGAGVHVVGTAPDRLAY